MNDNLEEEGEEEKEGRYLPYQILRLTIILDYNIALG